MEVTLYVIFVSDLLKPKIIVIFQLTIYVLEDLGKLQVENWNILGMSPYTTIYTTLIIRLIEAKTMSKHNPIPTKKIGIRINIIDIIYKNIWSCTLVIRKLNEKMKTIGLWYFFFIFSFYLFDNVYYAQSVQKKHGSFLSFLGVLT